MRHSRLPDIFVCAMAIVGGVIVHTCLHNRWYHGGWMQLFGDPPAANPSYCAIKPLFMAAPFAGGAMAVGLIAGIGYATDWQGFFCRLGTIGLSCILSGAEHHGFSYAVFLPIALLCFGFSATISWVYGVLLLRALERVKPQPAIEL